MSTLSRLRGRREYTCERERRSSEDDPPMVELRRAAAINSSSDIGEGGGKRHVAEMAELG